MSASSDATACAFLNETRGQLALCQHKIHHCLGQLSDQQLWHRAGEDFNSIANLVLHLTGNISQRFLSVVGNQPDTRNRDAEFAERGPIAKSELLAGLDGAIERADAVLAALDSARLLESRRYRRLRGEVEVSVLAVILQTLVHVGGHTQEIIALARLQLRDDYRYMDPAARP
jgi:hypothetical protein